MKRGTGKHPVTPGAVVNIRTDAEFTVYAVEKGVRTSILGPDHATQRQYKIRIPHNLSQIEVTTRKSGRWLITETINPPRKEIPDKTPVEIGIKEEYDPQAEMVRQITESVLSKVAEKAGHETLEEADDFDIEDEPEPRSPYELQEMQEEVPLFQPPTKPKETAPEPLPPGEGLGTVSEPAVQPEQPKAPPPDSPPA